MLRGLNNSHRVGGHHTNRMQDAWKVPGHLPGNPSVKLEIWSLHWRRLGWFKLPQFGNKFQTSGRQAVAAFWSLQSDPIVLKLCVYILPCKPCNRAFLLIVTSHPQERSVRKLRKPLHDQLRKLLLFSSLNPVVS